MAEAGSDGARRWRMPGRLAPQALRESAADGAAFALSVLLYACLGAASLSTAYVQANAAAVWMPAGFSVGLLVVRGLGRWPAVAVASLVLNSVVNLLAPDGPALAVALAAAALIALGNTLEALAGAWLTRRFAGGAAFLSRPRGLAVFSLVAAPLPPVLSAAAGVAASWCGGLTRPETVVEVTVTWYIANVVGILIFAGPTVWLLTRRGLHLKGARLLEALALLAGLVFVSQSISGLYIADIVDGWPRLYMVMPLLCWAGFRFGTAGALFSIVLVVVVATLGTMRGFQAFPAETPSRSLLYLQMFLAMLSVMTLSIAAARAEVQRLQDGLEERVRQRTAEVERLMREKEVFTTLVAHDLQSPLYGVRNALRAAIDAIGGRRMALDEAARAMAVMEEACAALAERVGGLLVPKPAAEDPPPAPERISVLIARILAAHRVTIDRRGADIRFSGDRRLALRRAEEVEHILDILIENALRYTSGRPVVEVAAYAHGGAVDILVSDNGPGVPASEVSRLFLRRAPDLDGDERPRNGLGLHLASELASRLGGSLSYWRREPSGSCFRLSLPR
ncbi:MASE1 domain-containing protein [Ensifer soli]|uniref:MASE1 domain-containing protein n=1 Tax=Ciceribacter sp. sgz301302 TaxID=3342379 RepID=UPI0035BA1891